MFQDSTNILVYFSGLKLFFKDNFITKSDSIKLVFLFFYKSIWQPISMLLKELIKLHD